jgi:GGDEF domain-containing protein
VRAHRGESLACLDAQAALSRRLAEPADHDGLTGCLSHRAFHERLGVELERAVREGTDVSVGGSMSAARLVRLADEAAYEAKRRGGNAVEAQRRPAAPRGGSPVDAQPRGVT